MLPRGYYKQKADLLILTPPPYSVTTTTHRLSLLSLKTTVCDQCLSSSTSTPNHSFSQLRFRSSLGAILTYFLANFQLRGHVTGDCIWSADGKCVLLGWHAGHCITRAHLGNEDETGAEETC